MSEDRGAARKEAQGGQQTDGREKVQGGQQTDGRKPVLSVIVAMARNRVIGKDDGLPWRLPAEMAYFRETTTGHPVIMGRKTYESIGRPLKNRRNIIITRDRSFRADGCEVVHSPEEALALVRGADEAFVIGGAEVIARMMPWVDKLYLTHIDHEFEGDVFFPELDMREWREVSRRPGVTDERNPYRYEFVVYRRARNEEQAGVNENHREGS